jgi:hypothetical protein
MVTYDGCSWSGLDLSNKTLWLGLQHLKHWPCCWNLDKDSYKLFSAHPHPLEHAAIQVNRKQRQHPKPSPCGNVALDTLGFDCSCKLHCTVCRMFPRYYPVRRNVHSANAARACCHQWPCMFRTGFDLPYLLYTILEG